MCSIAKKVIMTPYPEPPSRSGTLNKNKGKNDLTVSYLGAFRMSKANNSFTFKNISKSRKAKRTEVKHHLTNTKKQNQFRIQVSKIININSSI